MKPAPPIIPYFCDYCKKIHDERNNQEDEWDIHVVFLNEQKTKGHLDSIGKSDDFQTIMQFCKYEKSKSKRLFIIISLGALIAISLIPALSNVLPFMASFEIPTYLKIISIVLSVFLIILLGSALYISNTSWDKQKKWFLDYVKRLKEDMNLSFPTYPNFDNGSLVNLMASIQKLYGLTSQYAPLEFFPEKEFQETTNIVFLLLDGLGYNYLQKYEIGRASCRERV